MATNTFKLRSRVRYTRIWNCGSGESKLYKSVLSKVAKRKNHQAPDLVKFTRHSPQAGETTPVAHGGNHASCSRGKPRQLLMGEITPVAHGGNPQDRTGSPKPHWLPKTALAPQDRAASPRRWLLKLLTGETQCRN
ncbi:MAG: hypothetical protein V7K47_14240 [Nostoc sp.]